MFSRLRTFLARSDVQTTTLFSVSAAMVATSLRSIGVNKTHIAAIHESSVLALAREQVAQERFAVTLKQRDARIETLERRLVGDCGQSALTCENAFEDTHASCYACRRCIEAPLDVKLSGYTPEWMAMARGSAESGVCGSLVSLSSTNNWTDNFSN